MNLSICTIRWRPSGGRGEWEFVPADSLQDMCVYIQLPPLNVTIPAEVSGAIRQGKPRLRKFDSNNRSKLHLVPLVMALARLPDPAREDKLGSVRWPLENKAFLVSHMDFRVLGRTTKGVVLEPIAARILHSSATIDLTRRFAEIADDIKSSDKIEARFPDLAAAIKRHRDHIVAGENNLTIRQAADEVLECQAAAFGDTNSVTVMTAIGLPPTELEENINGKEGRILTRLHSFRERDRQLVVKAKRLFKQLHGRLYCECCGFEPAHFYGLKWEDRIQAHHKKPLEELLPDSITTPDDLAMVCPNCHYVIHARRPWLNVDELRKLLLAKGTHYFK